MWHKDSWNISLPERVQMLVLIPIPSSALFLEKSLSLLVVSPSPAEGGNPRTLLFCTRRLQFHSHFCVSSFQLFPPIPSPQPGCCLLAPLATLPWCQLCPPLFAGIMGILWYEKWYKNQIQRFSQLSLQCSPTSTYPRPTRRATEELLRLTEAAALLPNAKVKSCP